MDCSSRCSRMVPRRSRHVQTIFQDYFYPFHCFYYNTTRQAAAARHIIIEDQVGGPPSTLGSLRSYREMMFPVPGSARMSNTTDETIVTFHYSRSVRACVCFLRMKPFFPPFEV